MKRFALVGIVAFAICALAAPASAAGWSSSVPFTNQVADQVVSGGGHAGYDAGATAPNPGSCRLGAYNANRSKSWIAVQPGTEDLVGTSKIFFEKFSIFYNFHLGAHTFLDGRYAGSSMVTGYDCVSTGTQDMSPSWTIDTTLQAFKDSGSGAVPVGGNVRISNFSWDPTQPLQTIDGLPQESCAEHSIPCHRGFIGDYFGLAISAQNIYAFFLSTHYPSSVIGDQGTPVYYQQQVLSTIQRSAFGPGF